MFGAVVTVVVQHVTAVAFRSAVAAAVVVVVLCVVAAAEQAVTVSAVEMFVIGALVVHDVAEVAVAAVPQALLKAVARGHCFVVD